MNIKRAIRRWACFKRCTRCEKYLHKAEFNDRVDSIDKKQSYCKSCYKKYYKKRRGTPEQRRGRKHYVKHYGTAMLKGASNETIKQI